jgi:hypothetical protein
MSASLNDSSRLKLGPFYIALATFAIALSSCTTNKYGTPEQAVFPVQPGPGRH